MTTTPTTPWAHLPNAPHIDRILADMKARPEVWDAARVAARDAALDAARDAALDAARDAARDAALDAALYAAWVAARVAARVAITALIAWDDCSHLLDYTPDEVRALAAIGSPAAILLLPAVIALNT